MRLKKWALCAVTSLTLAISGLHGDVGANPPGLSVIDSGAAAYYGPGWDGAGWDRIRRTQAANHGLSPDQVYDPDGWYCVKIGYPIGAVLTLRNDDTGAVGTCVVADTNAPQDNAVWLSRWVVEVSWKAFHELGLDQGNHVSVWG